MMTRKRTASRDIRPGTTWNKVTYIYLFFIILTAILMNKVINIYSFFIVTYCHLNASCNLRACNVTDILNGQPHTESIEWFIENHASSPPYDLAPPWPLPPSPVSKLDRLHTGDRKTEKERQLADGRGCGGSVRGRSQIRRQRQSLVFCN